MSNIPEFGKTGTNLSKNPLGIIALFIVLVYGLASFVAIYSSSFTPEEKIPIIYFLVIFPVLVLFTFAWLVSRHAGKLYSPADFKNEENYVQIVAALTAAKVRQPVGVAGNLDSEVDVRSVAQFVREVSSKDGVASKGNRQNLLWVDDRPENNVYERRAFEALGLNITLALSTQQALELLADKHFSAIISDMGRKEGPQEGYLLLDKVRELGSKTPFFIYSGSKSHEHRRETAMHGGQGTTNDPQELFEMVTRTLIHR